MKEEADGDSKGQRGRDRTWKTEVPFFLIDHRNGGWFYIGINVLLRATNLLE